MQEKNQNTPLQIKPFHPIFPLQFITEQNIYFLTQNSFANKLVELCIGNKVQNQEKQKFTWYLYPEETFYLISVWSYTVEQQKNYRQSFIMKIYKNSQPQDIETIHFYLNLRKRNLFYKRIGKFSFKPQILSGKEENKSKQEIAVLFENYKIFKIYQLNQDYRNDQNYEFYVLVEADKKISEILFNPNLAKIKQTLKIDTLKLCIIKNNDFIVTKLNSF